jgi:thymidylate kinase
MTDSERNKLIVRPAQGPLAWLFPELMALVPQNDLDPVPDRLDLNRQGVCGAPLLEALAKHSSRNVEIEDGPRGHALWTWLSQALDREELIGERPGLAPKALSTEAMTGAEGDFPLEAFLKHMAGLCDGKGTVLIEGLRKGAVKARTAPLSRKQAGEVQKRLKAAPGDLLWLLPLAPSSGLGDRLQACIETVAKDPVPFRHAGLFPFFDTALNEAAKDGGEAAESRLLPSWWGILPGDHWPRPIRVRYLELLRLLHPDRIFLFMTLENYALAGVDCFVEGVMDRFGTTAPRRDKKKSRPLILGICGTDGSGKSSHVAALEAHIIGMGLRVCVHKIYRHGVFHDTVTDLTRRCAGGRNLHLWRLQRIIKAFDSMKYFYSSLERELDEHDVVIFDRYVFTHYAAGAGRYHHDPFARELLSPFPDADRIYLLDVPTDEAIRRIGTRKERTVDENEYMLSRYRHALLDLADRCGFKVLDALAPFEENKRNILDDAERLIEARGLIGGEK